MRLLWITTKPPVPPVDGGRLVALLTIEALAREGVEVTLVAPLPADGDGDRIAADLAPVCRPRLIRASAPSAFAAASRSLLGGLPHSAGRHALREVRAEVARRVAAESFDVVHAEQLQAFAQAEPALRVGLPVVLRAQNVESDLWHATADLHPWAGAWLAREARRLARYEGETVRRAAATVALTERDAERLRELAGGEARVEAVPPPFPAELPPADSPLRGSPPLVLLGSGGWLPNRDGTRWFLEEVWPEVHARTPGAVLHLFAAGSGRPRQLPPGVALHPPPRDSREAFAANAVLVVPLRIASGIRMKILEAWARGVPVIATPEATEGLEANDGEQLLLGNDVPQIAAAVRRLATESGLARDLRIAGRKALLSTHDPAAVGASLAAVYAAQSPDRP